MKKHFISNFFHQEIEDVTFENFQLKVLKKKTFVKEKSKCIKYARDQKVMQVTSTFWKVGVKWYESA